MLLRELLKNTPEESVQERRGLEEGLKMMAKIGAVVNDVCKANNMVQTDFEHVVNFRTHKMVRNRVTVMPISLESNPACISLIILNMMWSSSTFVVFESFTAIFYLN